MNGKRDMSFVERLKQRARRLKTDTLALYLAYRDPRTPWHARVVSAVVVGYALSPIDLIPDFIPVLGYLDDLILIPLGIALSVKLIPAEVMAECRERAQDLAERPTNRVVAGIIVLVWLVLAGLTLSLVMRIFGS